MKTIGISTEMNKVSHEIEGRTQKQTFIHRKFEYLIEMAYPVNKDKSDFFHYTELKKLVPHKKKYEIGSLPYTT